MFFVLFFLFLCSCNKNILALKMKEYKKNFGNLTIRRNGKNQIMELEITESEITESEISESESYKFNIGPGLSG